MINLANTYPELYDYGLWGQEDDEAYERFMRDTTTEVLGRMAQNSLTVTYIGERACRLFIDRPLESDDSFIVFPGEFGNGTKEPGQNRPTGALLRAHAVREMINPHATLIVQPNDTRKENNLNLSRDERKYMASSGSTLPVVDRIRSATGDSEDVTIVGLSQGAVVATDFILHSNPQAVAVVEAPNVVARTRLQLAKAFFTSGSHLHDNLEIGGNQPQTNIEKIKGSTGYVLGFPTLSNVALLNSMLKDTLGHALVQGVDRGIGITHAWANKTDVSPDKANQMIASQIGPARKNYQKFTLNGEQADHTITHVKQLLIAVTRRAIEISNRSR